MLQERQMTVVSVLDAALAQMAGSSEPSLEVQQGQAGLAWP